MSNECSCGVGMGVHKLGCVLLSVGPVVNVQLGENMLRDAADSRGMIEQMVLDVQRHVERAGFDEVVRLLRERGWLVVSPQDARSMLALGAAAGAFSAVFLDADASDEQERSAAWQLHDAVRAFVDDVVKEMRGVRDEPQD